MPPVGIAGGDWDVLGGKHRSSQLRPFRNLAIFKLLQERYVQQRPWEETTLYKARHADPNAACTNFPDRRYDTLEAMRAQFRTIDKLHESIRREGFRMGEPSAGTTVEQIVVNIGREGQFIWNGDGQHRLCLAILLDVPLVPVLVRVRHRLWQQIRHDHARRGPVVGPLASHPDLLEFTAEISAPVSVSPERVNR